MIVQLTVIPSALYSDALHKKGGVLVVNPNTYLGVCEVCRCLQKWWGFTNPPDRAMNGPTDLQHEAEGK